MSSNRKSFSHLATLLGVASALAVMLSVGLFIQGWAERRLADEERSKIFDRSYPELEAFRQEQADLLEGYYWVDEESGRVHLPIERAMELVVADAEEVAK